MTLYTYIGQAQAFSYSSVSFAWAAKLVLWFILVLLVTYLSTSYKFRKLYIHNTTNNETRQIPTMPYCLPGIGHALQFFDPAAGLSAAVKRYGQGLPLLARFGPASVVILTDQDQINAVYRATKVTTNAPGLLYTLRSLFGLPKTICDIMKSDDSGLKQKPAKGSTTPPERRLYHLIRSNLKKHLTPQKIEGIGKTFAERFTLKLERSEVGTDYIEFPDLFRFMHHIVTRPTVEALFGTKLLELCPSFVDDLYIYQKNVPRFLRSFPAWTFPKGHAARKRLLTGIKAWHTLAEQHVDCTNVTDVDPSWEPYWGNSLNRARCNYRNKIPEMTGDCAASDDLGIMFASLTNVQIAAFWFVLEAHKDPQLYRRLLSEVEDCAGDGATTVNMVRFAEKPLAQSMYAEVLRLYVAAGSLRELQQDADLAGFRFNKGVHVALYNQIFSKSEESWLKAGRELRKPLADFDAERFLVDSDWVRPGRHNPKPSSSSADSDSDVASTSSSSLKSSSKSSSTMSLESTFGSIAKGLPATNKRFTMDGLLGIWFPFGEGDHICPGNRLAKHQILLIFAEIVSTFDIQLSGANISEVKPDFYHAPFGSLPPTASISFRIKRKAVSKI